MISNRLTYLFSRNKRMIAGNWKSNFTQNEAVNFVKNTVQNIKFNSNNVGMYCYSQMLLSHLCSCISPAFWHSIATRNQSIKLLLRTAPTITWEPILEKSAQSISKILGLTGSFLDILKEEPSSRKMTNLLSQKLNQPSKMDLKSSTALGKLFKVISYLFRKGKQSNLGSSRFATQTST